MAVGRGMERRGIGGDLKPRAEGESIRTYEKDVFKFVRQSSPFSFFMCACVCVVLRDLTFSLTLYEW